MDLTSFYPCIFITIISTLISLGDTIECYQCNSHKVPECKEQPKALIATHYMNCTTGTRCRKIYQDIDGEVRVIRQCAENLGEIGCASRAGTYKIKMEYCECDTDGCNAASTPGMHTGLMGLVGLIVGIGYMLPQRLLMKYL